MRKLVLALLLFTAANSIAQPKIVYYQPTPASFAAQKVAKTDLEADIRYWIQVMEESHVNPYHAISKAGLEKEAQRVLAALPDSVSHAQATFALSELVALLNEGHLGLAGNPLSDSLYLWTAERFPYFLRGIDSTGFVIEYDLSTRDPKLTAGSTILSVNGHNALELYKKYSKYYGGLETWRRVRVKDAIRKLLFMDNITAPFTITAKQGNDTVQFVVPGFTRSQGDSISRVLASLMPGSEPFLLKFLEGNTALIEFNDMDTRYAKSFAAFLDSSFRLIKERKVKGLVIDIRRNGGGNSALGEMLISYFTGKRYRSAGGVKIKISEHARAMDRLSGREISFPQMANGSIYEHKITKLKKPEPRANRFKGKTAVLIGSGTFSSANMLANAIKDYKLATLFGESTAEPGNDFGEIFPFMLPRTHIIATTAIKMFVRANGDEKDFEGIKPDVYVSNVPGGGDEVLRAALKWVQR